MTLRQRLDSQAAHGVVGLAILFCAVVVGLESSSLSPMLSARFFRIADGGITLFFSVEVVLRIAAEPKPWEFFRVFHVAPRPVDGPRFALARLTLNEHGFWNVFDFTVTVLSVIAILVTPSDHVEYPLAARLLRIFRVLRLFELGPQLRRVEKQIVAVIPTVFSFILLLAVLLYVFAIFGTHLFADGSTQVADFSSVEKSYLTLFQVMTLDNWSDVMHAVQQKHPWLGPLYFIAFIVLTAIVSLNVFIAMLSQKVEEAMANEECVQRTRESIDDVQTKELEILAELARLREQLSAMEERLSRR